MLRLPAFPALLALLASTPSLAQQAQPPAAPVQAAVQGLAATDLLNVRQEPAPLGRTEGRLPPGALVTRHECRVVEGYEWCRIDAVHPDDGTELAGWTPGRYLVALDVLDAGPLDAPPLAPEPEDAAGREARLGLEDEAAALPPGIEDRFAGGESLPVEEVRNGAGEAGESGAAPGIPVPTPRPGTEEPGDTQAETLAGLPTAPARTPAAVLDSEIPCARYLGQPMIRCAARIVRTGPDAATVTVTWPDGGARVLDFRDGAPAGSDGRGAFRFTREASLNLIRIGASERFEILDALPFGD